jgi:phenylglyoxylate dehydrogenase epsilon subunit
MNILILGAGAAGLSAAKTILENEPSARLTIVQREDCLPYSPVVLPYYIEGKISKQDMCLLGDRNWPPGVEAVRGKAVRSIEQTGRGGRVALDDGRVIGYERLLICTGASPAMPDPAALAGKNFVVLRTLEDADRILSAGAKRIATLGAGPVAVELAIALKRKGLEVTLIVRSRVMRRLFDPDFSEIIKDIMVAGGVDVLLGQSITEPRGTPPETVLVDRTGIACDMLVVALGVKPNLDFLQGSGITTGGSGGIVVDGKMRTSVDYVYAAGDCAETEDYVTGKRGINAIWPEAVVQGKIAALNMIGAQVTYPGGISRNVINVFGVPVFSAGSLVGEKKTVLTPLARVRYTFRDARIVGIQSIGEVSKGSILAPILKGSKHPDWLLRSLRPNN